MKKLYVEGLPSYHEMDEMVFKYVLYEDNELLEAKTVYHDYRKPALTGLYAVILLMKEFPKLKNQEVEIIMNEGALLEQIKGTSTTRNRDILKVADLCRRQMSKFGGKLKLVSVSGNHEGKVEWESRLDV